MLSICTRVQIITFFACDFRLLEICTIYFYVEFYIPINAKHRSGDRISSLYQIVHVKKISSDELKHGKPNKAIMLTFFFNLICTFYKGTYIYQKQYLLSYK